MNGKDVVDKEEIKKPFTIFYRGLFSKNPPLDVRLNWEHLFPGERLNLNTPFSEDEITNAVFSLARDMALGSDGFPMSFYQWYWTTIKVDICRLFEDFHSGTTDLTRPNYTFMAPIPKKTNNLSVEDYRLISLTHGIMKIISKALSIRLSNFMENLIPTQQSAFIKGRFIGDGVLTIAEIIMHGQRSNLEGFIL